MEYSTQLEGLLDDSRLTDAHRRIITVLMEISPDTMPYAELAKRSEYKKSTAQKLVSEASLVVVDHGFRLIRRSRGREVWVGIEEFPPARRPAAWPAEPARKATSTTGHSKKEFLDWEDKEPSPEREIRPAPSFGKETIRSMLDLCMMQLTLRNCSSLLNIQRPAVSTPATSSFLEDIITFRIMMKML